MSMHRKSIKPTDQQAQADLTRLRQALTEGESTGKLKLLDMAAIKAAGRKRMKSGKDT